MLKLKIKPEAENDLSKIFEYTAMNWGVDQADNYQDDLFAGMKLITTQEQLGKEYPYAERSYRKLHVKRHLIFYRIENKTCIIIRILHDRMDIMQHLT
ncbi:MAG: toxin ParE1/3/4 [Saprospiraceae bacterium]|jgi:toxin ParE1/3/4